MSTTSRTEPFLVVRGICPAHMHKHVVDLLDRAHSGRQQYRLANFSGVAQQVVIREGCRSDLTQRPRYQMRYTPTYSSWLNQSGTLVWHHHPARDSLWFVPRVHDLVEKIDAFVQRYNCSSRPFAWTATADSILQKIARVCSRNFPDTTLEVSRERTIARRQG
jgi:hypothetical protein